MRLLALPAIALAAALAACAPQGAVVTTGDPVPAPSFERRLIGTINFNFDSYRIRPDSYALLDSYAVAMNDPALVTLRIDVNGHTDIIGRLAYNIALSNLRAAAVVDYLTARGVDRGRMRIQGFGPLQPLDPVNLASPVNRRVEVVLYR